MAWALILLLGLAVFDRREMEGDGPAVADEEAEEA
jgi:hypothetical protein